VEAHRTAPPAHDGNPLDVEWAQITLRLGGHQIQYNLRLQKLYSSGAEWNWLSAKLSVR